MNAAAAYTFPLRALRRWRDERLTLTDQPDGGIHGEFRFEGSTCGNVPFNLIYTVRLASAAAPHRILELACSPAPGDDGHRRMCSYLDHADRLLATLQTDSPLLDQPLAAALAWQPVTSPSGCVCDARARAHKWLAVLQTLHLALAERAATQPVSS
jgi:hypothetical protein